MLEQFYPGEYLDSAYEIDYEKLAGEGYRGVIFDIDNTLVPHGAPADERAVRLFGRLKSLGLPVLSALQQSACQGGDVQPGCAGAFY